MFARGLLLIATGTILVFAGAGCGSSKSPPTVVDESYPVRSDWLLVGQIPGDPSRGMEPGYPPSMRLDAIKALKTEPIDSDDRVLKQAVFLNARATEIDVREELGKVLTKWFGTPAKPLVLPIDDELKTTV